MYVYIICMWNIYLIGNVLCIIFKYIFNWKCPSGSHEIVPCKSLRVIDQEHQLLRSEIQACGFRGCCPPAAPRQWRTVAGIVRWVYSKEVWDSSDGSFGLRTPCWFCQNFLRLHGSLRCLNPTFFPPFLHLRSECFVLRWFAQPF